MTDAIEAATAFNEYYASVPGSGDFGSHEFELIDSAFTAGRESMRATCANWLRQNANAEKDMVTRAAFIEAHNALLAL